MFERLSDNGYGQLRGLLVNSRIESPSRFFRLFVGKRCGVFRKLRPYIRFNGGGLFFFCPLSVKKMLNGRGLGVCGFGLFIRACNCNYILARSGLLICRFSGCCAERYSEDDILFQKSGCFSGNLICSVFGRTGSKSSVCAVLGIVTFGASSLCSSAFLAA